MHWYYKLDLFKNITFHLHSFVKLAQNIHCYSLKGVVLNVIANFYLNLCCNRITTLFILLSMVSINSRSLTNKCKMSRKWNYIQWCTAKHYYSVCANFNHVMMNNDDEQKKREQKTYFISFYIVSEIKNFYLYIQNHYVIWGQFVI